MKGTFKLIDGLSITILLVVGLLFGVRQKLDLGEWTASLPKINAVINTMTAIFLLTSLYFIKNKNIRLHKLFNTLAFCFGGVFLIFYVIYHLTHASTTYGGTGISKTFYFFILISHILGSFLVLPLVLRTMYFGLNRLDKEHTKVSKWAFPIWLYVSVTGVIAYLMISPYYTF